jgi:hypothetical protein
MTLDPQSAAAASICWLARWQGDGTYRAIAAAATTRHPSECAWCVYPLDALISMVEDFNEADERLAYRFAQLPSDEQRARVERAMYGEAVR